MLSEKQKSRARHRVRLFVFQKCCASQNYILKENVLCLMSEVI